MDFLEDLEKIILKKAGNIGIRMDYKEVNDLLRKYINVKSKLVEERPRKVYYSSELQSKLPEASYFDDLKIIEKKFEDGEDINPHLSTRVLKPNNQDGLLNDWRIRHLHISNTKWKPTDKFYKRSDYLLMFIEGKDFACFLDVRPHSESRTKDLNKCLWVRNELLEILQDNWEELLEPYELKEMKTAEKYTNEEFLQLREAGVFMFTIIRDKVYQPPGGGTTTASTGASQSNQAIVILNKICEKFREIKENPDKYKELMQKDSITPPKELNFKLIDEPTQGLICVETNTDWNFPLNIKL
jgi:hypothetical protein